MTLDPLANEEKTLGGSIPPHPRAARAAKEEAPACCQTGSYSGDVRFDLGMHLHHLQLVMSSVAISQYVAMSIPRKMSIGNASRW